MTDDFIPRSVLLVEDEPRLRQTLQRSLAGRGYEVDLATTVAEACAKAMTGAHDVMLLDVNLPDATGWDVLRALRNGGYVLPSIVLSAAPPNPARVREFRPAGILYKPFPMDALLRLIQSACANAEGKESDNDSDLHRAQRPHVAAATDGGNHRR